MNEVDANNRPEDQTPSGFMRVLSLADESHYRESVAARGPASLGGPRSFSDTLLRDLLIHAIYNRRTITLTALIPLLIGLAAAMFAQPRYTAETVLIVFVGGGNTAARAQDVAGVRPVNLSVTGLKEVTSELDIILSSDTIRRAVRNIGPSILYPAIGERRFLGLMPAYSTEQQLGRAEILFRAQLRATVQTDTNIIRITFTFPDRTLAIHALQALVDSYLGQRRKVFVHDNSPFLTSELKGYMSRLKEIEEEIQKVRQDYDVLEIAQDLTLTSNRIDSIQQQRAELLRRREAMRAQAASAAERLATVPRHVFASRERTNQASNDDSRNTLLRLQVERDHVATQYAQNSPLLRELDGKIASARAAIVAATGTNYVASRVVRNPAEDVLDNQLLAAQIEDNVIAKQLEQVNQEVTYAQKRAAQLRLAQTKLHDLQRSRDVIESNYRQFALREAGARIDEEANRDRNTNVHVVQQPIAPVDDSSIRWSYILAGIFSGTTIGAGAAALSTFLRKVYILPGEAERHLKLAALADLPVGKSDDNIPIATLGVANLAALLLDLLAEGNQHSVLQFVSSGEDDGKSALVRVLATEFALVHSLNTLIVDLQADGREHLAILGNPTEQQPEQLCNTLHICSTGVPKVRITLDAAKSDLASSRVLLPRSRLVLLELRKQFDMILIIAPAQIYDYSSRRLSTLVDTNIVILQADRTPAPAAELLRHVLMSAGAPILGFIFTGHRTYIPPYLLRWL